MTMCNSGRASVALTPGAGRSDLPSGILDVRSSAAAGGVPVTGAAAASRRARSLPGSDVRAGPPERGEQILRAVPRATVVLAGSRSPADLQRMADESDVILSVRPGDPAGPLAAELAMWRGRPFVGPDEPAIRTLVVDGVTGFLTRADGQDGAMAVRRLLASPFWALALGWAGRSRAEALQEYATAEERSRPPSRNT